MSTRFKNILSILFVTLFLLGNILSASAAAPEAVTPKDSSLVLQQAARPEYLFPCNINLAGNWATVRGTTRTNAQLLQDINNIGRTGHGTNRYAIDFNTNTSWKGPRAWGVCQNLDVLAARTGTVARVDSDCGAVWLQHPDGQYSFYLHMTKTSIQNVKVGNTYQAGQKIGTMGSTAHAGKCSATGVHLHFAVTSSTNYISNELGLDKWVFTLPGGISGDTTFVKGNSELTINSEAVNLKVCADNLNGKPVYWQMWRNTVGSYPERVWNGSGVASGSCITFSDLDGAGPVFKDVTYYTVASLNPIAAGQAKLQRTACYTATGGKQLCDAIAFKEGATCTAGKNVDNAFLLDVISNLNTQTEYNISNTEFALKALQIWRKYEGTNACWNPLATTWGRPNATNFNSVGVKNYATREDGVAATANTIGTRNAANYSFIRQMLGLKGFDEAGLVANLKKYSGGGAYVTNMMNEWRALYNQYAEITPPPAQNIPEFNYPVNGQTLDYEGHYIFEVKPVNGATGFLWGFEQNGQLIWENWRDEGKLNDTGYRITPNTAAHNKFSPGPVKVIVRAQIDGKWSEARIITIHLKPREGENPPAQNIPEFNYPVNGQTLDYEGHYIFEVKPVNGATGFLWGFEQNGQLIWENWRDEGKLNDTGYRITPNTAAHNKFSPGPVKVIVRAQIDGKWSEAQVITIHLKPKDDGTSPQPPMPVEQSQASMQWTSPSVEKGQSITAHDFSFDPQGQPVKGLEYVCTPDNARLQYKNATVGLRLWQ
jgi:murein DD-endopeptidase MepM/ murein hydrolase activator NlpD